MNLRNYLYEHLNDFRRDRADKKVSRSTIKMIAREIRRLTQRTASSRCIEVHYDLNSETISIKCKDSDLDPTFFKADCYTAQDVLIWLKEKWAFYVKADGNKTVERCI